MLSEFKAFIMRGNVLDLAVAVIIGGAFGKIVTSFVNDVILPPVGLLLGNVDFSNLYVSLSGAEYASLAEALSAHYPAMSEMVRSQDFVEGPRAFAEKRKPRWQGR